MFGITINKAELNKDLQTTKAIGIILFKSSGIIATAMLDTAKGTYKLINNEIKTRK